MMISIVIVRLYQKWRETMSKMITASMMKKFVLGAGLYSYFKYSQGDLQMATYDEMTSGDGLFNMIEAHPDNVIGLFDLMIAQELDIDLNTKLVSLKAECIAHSNQESEPEPEPELIELDLESLTDEHIINFAINESLENQSQVKVMCRYGSGDDLTPWHELTSRAVRFKQDTYSVFIPQCQHDTRELKLVSPVGLTVL